MNDANNAIDRVLAAINETEAPAGLEERVVRKAQDNGYRSSSWRGLWQLRLVEIFRAALARRPAWVRVGAAVASAMLLLATLQRVHRARSRLVALVRPPALQVASPLQATPRAALARGSEPLNSRQQVGVARQVGRRAPSRALAPAATAIPTPMSQDPMEASAWSEMRAPSRPAPPLPLNDQEKRLQRMVHRGNSVELAELDPAEREAVAARDEAEFQTFFKTPAQENNPESH